MVGKRADLTVELPAAPASPAKGIPHSGNKGLRQRPQSARSSPKPSSGRALHNGLHLTKDGGSSWAATVKPGVVPLEAVGVNHRRVEELKEERRQHEQARAALHVALADKLGLEARVKAEATRATKAETLVRVLYEALARSERDTAILAAEIRTCETAALSPSRIGVSQRPSQPDDEATAAVQLIADSLSVPIALLSEVSSADPARREEERVASSGDEERAASRLGAAARGRLARQDVALLRGSVSVEAPLPLPGRISREVECSVGEQAATWADQLRWSRIVEPRSATLNEEALAATQISAASRGHRARKEVAARRSSGRQQGDGRELGEGPSADEARAATQISAATRGHRARKEEAARRSSRQGAAPAGGLTEEETHAATRIGAAARGFHGRREALSRRGASQPKSVKVSLSNNAGRRVALTLSMS